MAVPINITPEAAFEITTLPFSQTLDVTDAPTGTGYASTCDTNQYHAVWYRYTAQAGDTFLAVAVDRTAAGNFTPALSIWTGTPGSLTQFVIGAQNYCQTSTPGFYFNVPVTKGTTYYFQATDVNNTSPLGGSLIFRLQGQVHLAVPAGSILIPDDEDGFPAAAIAVDGGLLQWLPYPAGEVGDTMPDGTLCLQDGTSEDKIIFIDSITGNTIARVTYANQLVRAIKSDRSTYFYILTRPSAGGAATVRKISKLGVAGTTWTLPSDSDNNLLVFAVARDGSMCYYGKCNVDNEPIHSYNLNTSSAGSDLVAARVGVRPRCEGDGYVAADGSILFAWQQATDRWVERYDAAGLLLNTYDDPLDALVHFAFASDNPSSFVWRSDNNDYAYFTQIKLSDGSTIHESDPIPVQDTSGESNVVDVPYSISNTCPVVVFSVDVPSDAPDLTPDYTTTTLLRRRVRRAPIVWAEADGLQTQVRMNLFAVDIEPGVGTADVPDPVVMVRASADGGRTWLTERQMALGAVGQYATRLNSWRWGQGRQWVFEVSMTDPVRSMLINCYIDPEQGRS